MEKNKLVSIQQLDFSVGDLKKNADLIIAKANKADAEIVVFSELAICGYIPFDFLLKNSFIKECNQNIEYIKQQTKHIDKYIIFGAPIKDTQSGKLYNSAVVMKNGVIEQVIHKKALPNYDIFFEKRYFESGSGSNIATLGSKKVCIYICEDLWVEEVWKQEHEKLDLVISINASPFTLGKEKERLKILTKAHNHFKCPIVYCNTVGAQDETVFDGNSMFFNGKENVYALQSFKEEEKSFEINDKYSTLTCKTEKETQIHSAMKMGLKAYLNKNKIEGVVIGISGGIDSAVTLAICSQILPKEKIKAIFMPSKFTKKETYQDVMFLEKSCKIDILSVPILKQQQLMEEMLVKYFSPKDIVLQNIQPRIRMEVLMSFSNQYNYLLLANSNKSELFAGFATAYGDLSGGFNLVKDLLKTEIYELANHLNKKFNNIIPSQIINKPPSAELNETQIDADILGSYETLDKIIINFENDTLENLQNEFSQEYLTKIFTLFKINEYKRSQAPIGIRLKKESFNKDWLYPITNQYKMME